MIEEDSKTTRLKVCSWPAAYLSELSNVKPKFSEYLPATTLPEIHIALENGWLEY